MRLSHALFLMLASGYMVSMQASNDEGPVGPPPSPKSALPSSPSKFGVSMTRSRPASPSYSASSGSSIRPASPSKIVLQTLTTSASNKGATSSGLAAARSIESLAPTMDQAKSSAPIMVTAHGSASSSSSVQPASQSMVSLGNANALSSRESRVSFTQDEVAQEMKPMKWRREMEAVKNKYLQERRQLAFMALEADPNATAQNVLDAIKKLFDAKIKKDAERLASELKVKEKEYFSVVAELCHDMNVYDKYKDQHPQTTLKEYLESSECIHQIQ